MPKPSESFLYASGEQSTLDVGAPTAVTDIDDPFVVFTLVVFKVCDMFKDWKIPLAELP